jgi:membrane associated rhomboid family serine protease
MVASGEKEDNAERRLRKRGISGLRRWNLRIALENRILAEREGIRMFIPYQVDVPMQRWPIANWVLIGLTILISLAMFRPQAEWAQNAKIGMLPGLTPSDSAAVDFFLLQPDDFHVPQLVGNVFIHADFLHLAGNMLFLFIFGNAVNAKLGHMKYVLLYLGAGVMESLAWIAVGPKSPCLGASGAIMGIVGAFLMLYPKNNVSVGWALSGVDLAEFELPAMWVIAAYFAFDVWGLISEGNSGVAYLAHVVGFLVGAGMTAALLWFKWTEMDDQEQSLLQVWGIMPTREPTPLAPQQPAGGSRITWRGGKRCNGPRRSASGTKGPFLWTNKLPPHERRGS